jgi:hypothetical protein
LELKNEFDLFSLAKGGRLFYEIDVVDEVNDFITDCIFQGEIIIINDNEFPMKNNLIFILALGFLLIFIIFFIYWFLCLKSNKSKIDKSE